MIGAQITLCRNQIRSYWFLFTFGNLKSLTNVVYFDVWLDCVIGSLNGVLVCLGD